ncbi:aminotransferase class I/II-fold pyridoxal phosphate-dependent enzyme [Agrobacterium larrymoorei]|uniref:Aminotransferase class I/II-fold pyridoxal phosphate-dependent enzyme n=1 Tax=Agrobacterium larrymoorei TaxID=160699 RepID=A0ABX8T6A5_9HYPH|nr:aminotransferase class I/II-fold pyridoxal phosphate-dependent enzyme [Agrobacterium larrymoorei]QYA08658.1 aminotransferase class I/II-fold pyridoxal phosphate-dependent enzyme [Agrobacterium larrymoorei]
MEEDKHKPASKLSASSGMLEKLRSQRQSADASRSRRTAERSAAPSSSPQSFSELPEYKTIQIQKAAAQLVHVDNPFHRAHDTAAGAETIIDGRKLINFASYDYLGTNTHPEVKDAAKAAMDRFGISASASRVVAGERPLHVELEQALATNYGVEAAVCFVSGYLTNVTAISCLMGPQDLIIHDEFIHNSALTGAKLSGAKRLFFKHNDTADLERILTNTAGEYRRILVIVEGLYSMDGDVTALPAIVALKSRHAFWLMVDEAHALGVLGGRGRGTFEHYEVDPRSVDIWMGTLSKTSSSCGGYIAGTEALVEILKAQAGGFVYSVGLAPPLAAAAITSLKILSDEPDKVTKLRRNGELFLTKARAAGLDTGPSEGYSVVPVIVGDSLRAVELSNRLFQEGINALPIIHPAVPERLARLRFFVTSEHTQEQIETAVLATQRILQNLVDSKFGVEGLDVEQLQRLMNSG